MRRRAPSWRSWGVRMGLIARWGGALISAQVHGGSEARVDHLSRADGVAGHAGRADTGWGALSDRKLAGPSTSVGPMPHERGQVGWTWPVDGTRTPPGRSVIRGHVRR